VSTLSGYEQPKRIPKRARTLIGFTVGGAALDHSRSLSDCERYRGDPLVLDAGSFARLYQRAPAIDRGCKNPVFQRPTARSTDDCCREHLAPHGIRGSAVLHRIAVVYNKSMVEKAGIDPMSLSDICILNSCNS